MTNVQKDYYILRQNGSLRKTNGKWQQSRIPGGRAQRSMDNKARTTRPRLQRSERVFSESHLTSWEVFVRDSLLTLAWPDLLNVVSG
ncbi:hypothetical protein Trydic_g1624 [Trypoxylus dichotomus]